MCVGNDEVWGDPKIEGVLNAVPYLKALGVSPDNLIYKYDFNGVRFIFLWSGKYDYRSPSKWDGDRPKYAEQMKQRSAVARRHGQAIAETTRSSPSRHPTSRMATGPSATDDPHS